MKKLLYFKKNDTDLGNKFFSFVETHNGRSTYTKVYTLQTTTGTIRATTMATTTTTMLPIRYILRLFELSTGVLLMTSRRGLPGFMEGHKL